MQPGRTPGWNVIAEIETTSWLEAVQPASGDRLPLPAALRKRVSWCAPKTSLPLLASIRADGSVTVSPLAAQRAELAAIRGALDASDPSEREKLTFAAMATYSKIALQPDGRLRLSPMLALHLCAAPGGRVWVGAYGGTLRLWSEDSWKHALATASVSLREALALAAHQA